MPPKKVELSKVKISIAIGIVLILLGGIFFNPLYQSILARLTGTTLTIAVLPDTQAYSKSNPELFCKQTEWIAQNKDTRNIIFAAHMGDIVENFKFIKKEWDRASNCLSKLEGKVPHSVIPGNHDTETGTRTSGFATYNTYFPVSRYSKYEWYKGNYRENANNYEIVHNKGMEFLFLNLELEPSDNALDWANMVVQKHPRAFVIVSTHKYLPEDAKRDNTRAYSEKGNTGEMIWQKLITKNCNIELVLSGHFHSTDGEYMITSENVCGEQVPQILQNYQGRENGGNAKLRLYTFNFRTMRIRAETYSPQTDTYEIDSDSDFTLPIAHPYPSQWWSFFF